MGTLPPPALEIDKGSQPCMSSIVGTTMSSYKAAQGSLLRSTQPLSRNAAFSADFLFDSNKLNTT
jgi:hypothetical protein